MSIIGEIYEEEIWDSRRKLQEKCQQFLTYLNQKLAFHDEAYFHIWNIAEEFKEKFEKELKGNDN